LLFGLALPAVLGRSYGTQCERGRCRKSWVWPDVGIHWKY
jgi:hypothetical protein